MVMTDRLVTWDWAWQFAMTDCMLHYRIWEVTYSRKWYFACVLRDYGRSLSHSWWQIDHSLASHGRLIPNRPSKVTQSQEVRVYLLNPADSLLTVRDRLPLVTWQDMTAFSHERSLTRPCSSQIVIVASELAHNRMTIPWRIVQYCLLTRSWRLLTGNKQLLTQRGSWHIFPNYGLSWLLISSHTTCFRVVAGGWHTEVTHTVTRFVTHRVAGGWHTEVTHTVTRFYDLFALGAALQCTQTHRLGGRLPWRKYRGGE
jgi:hypothetical protein